MSRRLISAVKSAIKRTGFDIRRVHLRPMTSFLREKYGSNPIIGAEIGVLGGEHALELFENLNIQKMYLIDPYSAYSEYKETVNESSRTQTALSSFEIAARKRLQKYASRIVWVRKLSSEALPFIKDSLDFIYIDGNHQYEYVKEDVSSYYSLIKKAGVIGGHDYDSYQPVSNSEEMYGVVEAVNDFAHQKKKKVWFALSDWWIVK